jgi:hypothetical protein
VRALGCGGEELHIPRQAGVDDLTQSERVAIGIGCIGRARRELLFDLAEPLGEEHEVTVGHHVTAEPKNVMDGTWADVVPRIRWPMPLRRRRPARHQPDARSANFA